MNLNSRFREDFDCDVIDKIIDNFDKIIAQFPKERQDVILKDPNNDYLLRLKQLKAFATNKNYITTTYNYAKNATKGRLFAQNPSLQGLAREFRNTLCSENMVDFDFQNCHYEILNYYCEQNGLKHEYIGKYCIDRDGEMNKLIDVYEKKFSKNKIKKDLISILNGGSAIDLKCEFTNEIRKEMLHIHEFVIQQPENIDDYNKAVKLVKIKKLTSASGSVLNKIMCESERIALEFKCEFVAKYNFAPSVLMFDGALSENIDGVIVDDTFLNNCSEYVLLKTGIPLIVTSKPIERLDLTGYKTKKTIKKEEKEAKDFVKKEEKEAKKKLDKDLKNEQDADEKMDKEITKKEIKATDEQAKVNKTIILQNSEIEKIKAQYMLNNNKNKSLDEMIEQFTIENSHHNVAVILYLFIKDKVKSFRNGKGLNEFYVCNKYNVWEHHAGIPVFIEKYCFNEFSAFIRNYRDKYHKKYISSFSQEDLDKYITLKNLIVSLGSSKGIKFIVDCIAVYTYTPDFENSLDMNTDIFCFEDKLYDLLTYEIRDIKPSDLVQKTTGYLYPDRTLIKQEVFDKVTKFYKDIMPTKEMYEFNLNRATYCLTGTNKFDHIYIMQGKGGNGKTCLTTLEDHAFGGPNGYSYTFSQTTFTVKSRGKNETSELALTKGYRYSIIQEPDEGSKIQISIFKQLTGDAITCRKLYENNSTFKPQFKMNMACNDLPKLSSVDCGVGRRLALIMFEMSFCDKPVGEFDRLADRKLVDEFRVNVDYKNALIHILMDNWKNVVSKFTSFPLPACCAKSTAEYVDSSNELVEFVKDYYIIAPYGIMNKEEVNKTKYSEVYEHFKRVNQNANLDRTKFANRIDMIKNIKSKEIHIDIIGKDNIKKKSKCLYIFGLKCKDTVEFLEDSDDE